MKEKILALLVAAFSGVRKDGLMQLARTIALQCATEDEAKALVDKLTEAQVNDFVKEFRADVDKEVSESNKAYEGNLKKKFEFVEKKTGTEPGGGGEHKTNDPTDVAAIVEAAVAKAVAPFQTELASYKASGVAQTRLQSLNEKLANCKDKTFKEQTLKDFNRMKFDSDDEFNEYLSGKEADIATANQNMANANLDNGGGAPMFSQKEESGVSKGVADYLASKKPDANVLTGKEV